MRHVPNGKADTVMRAIVHAPHFLQTRVHKFICDNGSEFAEHALVDIEREARRCFAEPYSFCQRGTNENINGLTGQCQPEGCDLSAYSDAEIRAIEKNSTSGRKRFGLFARCSKFSMLLSCLVHSVVESAGLTTAGALVRHVGLATFA
jgi:IS30 family transposase